MNTDDKLPFSMGCTVTHTPCSICRAVGRESICGHPRPDAPPAHIHEDIEFIPVIFVSTPLDRVSVFRRLYEDHDDHSAPARLFSAEAIEAAKLNSLAEAEVHLDRFLHAVKDVENAVFGKRVVCVRRREDGHITILVSPEVVK